MFWRQLECFKDSFRTGTSTIADLPVQTKTILGILFVIVHYCLSAQCSLIRKLPLKNFSVIVSRTLPVSVYFKTINTRPSSEKCGLVYASTIFVQFVCSIRPGHSSVPLLGFTYRKALEHFQNV